MGDGLGMGWGCRFVGGKTRHVVWMVLEMGEDGRSTSEVAIFLGDVDIFVASEIILRCGCVESGHEKVTFASKKGILGLFFLWCGGCLCCIFTPKKLNIALTLSSLFRGYVTMLNFLACIFDLLGESRFELGNWGSNLPR